MIELLQLFAVISAIFMPVFAAVAAVDEDWPLFKLFAGWGVAALLILHFS